MSMARHPDDRSVELILPNQAGYERVAMACSASLARMHCCPEDRIEDLKTVVAEATINAMQHGNGWRPGACVAVRIEIAQGTIFVSVTDEGSGLHQEVRDPDIDSFVVQNAPITGFGLFLMRKLADNLEFDQTAGGGHRVRLAIKMRSRADSSLSGKPSLDNHRTQRPSP
jgi:anti-sigma regulatory factor (Ser/Thr protein kinase)